MMSAREAAIVLVCRCCPYQRRPRPPARLPTAPSLATNATARDPREGQPDTIGKIQKTDHEASLTLQPLECPRLLVFNNADRGRTEFVELWVPPARLFVTLDAQDARDQIDRRVTDSAKGPLVGPPRDVGRNESRDKIVCGSEVANLECIDIFQRAHRTPSGPAQQSEVNGAPSCRSIFATCAESDRRCLDALPSDLLTELSETIEDDPGD
jgi:hypothetical protein